MSGDSSAGADSGQAATTASARTVEPFIVCCLLKILRRVKTGSLPLYSPLPLRRKSNIVTVADNPLPGDGMAWPWHALWRWFGRRDDPGRAAALFDQDRPRLEQEFFQAARASGKPRGLRWKALEWAPGAVVARERATGRLAALVGVTIAFEAIEGSDMEGLPAVGNLPHGVGRVLLPRRAVAHYRQDRLQPRAGGSPGPLRQAVRARLRVCKWRAGAVRPLFSAGNRFPRAGNRGLTPPARRFSQQTLMPGQGFREGLAWG